MCHQDGAKSLGELWDKAIGKESSWFITLSVFTFALGGALAYSIVLGDAFSSLAQTIGLQVQYTTSTFVVSDSKERTLALTHVSIHIHSIPYLGMAHFTSYQHLGSHIDCPMATVQSKFPCSLGSLFCRWRHRYIGNVFIHGISIPVTFEPLCVGGRCLFTSLGTHVTTCLWVEIQFAVAGIPNPRVHFGMFLLGALFGSRLLSCLGKERDGQTHYEGISTLDTLLLWWSVSH